MDFEKLSRYFKAILNIKNNQENSGKFLSKKINILIEFLIPPLPQAKK